MTSTDIACVKSIQYESLTEEELLYVLNNVRKELDARGLGYLYDFPDDDQEPELDPDLMQEFMDDAVWEDYD